MIKNRLIATLSILAWGVLVLVQDANADFLPGAVVGVDFSDKGGDFIVNGDWNYPGNPINIDGPLSDTPGRDRYEDDDRVDPVTGAYLGDGVIGTTAYLWNLIERAKNQGFSSDPFNDSNGNATGVKLTWLGPSKFVSYAEAGGPEVNGTQRRLNDSLALGDMMWHGTEILFELNGLTAGASYNMAFYGGDPGFGLRGSTYTVGGQSASLTGATEAESFVQTFYEGKNYVRLNGLVADASGKLIVSVTPDDANFANISGLEIQAVAQAIPEPGSLALLGLGGLALLRRRR